MVRITHLLLLGFWIAAVHAGVLTPYIDKQYELIKSINVIALMNTLKVKELFVNIASKGSSYTKFKWNEEKEEYSVWSQISWGWVWKSDETPFKMGVEFDYKAPDGRKCKVTFDEKDGKLVQTLKDKSGEVMTVTKEFKGDLIFSMTEYKNVKSLRIYQEMESKKTNGLPPDLDTLGNDLVPISTPTA